MKEKNILTVLTSIIMITFFVPLLLLPNHFIFPFIVPKIVAFRSLTMLMLGIFVVILANNWKKYRTILTAPMLAVLLFFASFTISTISGVDWYRSFWDNHERMLGLFTIVHYIIFFIVLTSTIKKWETWRRLMLVFLGAGSIVMLLAVVQKVNPEFLINRGSGRVSATLGNAIYLGGYGMFIAFLAALVFIKEKTTGWKVYAAISGLLGIFGIFASGTRGAFLGFAAGIGVLCIGYILALHKDSKYRKIFVGIMIAGLLFLGSSYAFRTAPIVKSIPLVSQLVNTNITGGTANTRIMAWGIAVESWKERPVFGWGPNNYYHAFNKYYRPEFLQHGFQETWFDNAHSAFFNTLAVQGVLGMISYLGLFLVPLVLLWKRFREKKIDLQITVVGGAFLVAHFVQQFFVFENPTSLLYFFFWLAFLNQQTSTVEVEEKSTKLVSTGLLASIAVVVFLIILITNINPARANMAALGALQAVNSNKEPVEAYQKAISIASPHIDDIRNDFARVTVASAKGYVDNGLKDEAITLLDLVYRELDKNLQLHPKDIRVHLQKVQVGQLAAEVTQNPTFLVEAEALTKQAIEYSPQRQQLYYTLAGLQFQLGKPDEAIESIQKTIDLDPKVGESWWRLALIYKTIGQDTKAKETIEEAQQKNVSFDAQGRGIVKSIIGEDKSNEEDTDTDSESDQ